MNERILGRTGLRVTTIGLGCGGHSKLGQNTGRSHQESVALVRRALDRGISLIDTAEGYGTEEIVGEAIAGRRDGLVLATKTCGWNPDVLTPNEMTQKLEQSLKRLRVEAIDLYQMHGVPPDQYEMIRDRAVPVLKQLRQQGKIRFLGITEVFGKDTSHAMLRAALKDDCWDTLMVGFNLLNPSARHTVLPLAQARNIGVLCMFAVRKALTDPALARERLQPLIESGRLPTDVDLDFLTGPGAAASLSEAAYRFACHEPGIHCVLSGTGNPTHLDENIHAIQQPPLPDAVLEQLDRQFGSLDCLSGN